MITRRERNHGPWLQGRETPIGRGREALHHAPSCGTGAGGVTHRVLCYHN